MDPTENTFTINLVSNASTETYPGNSMAAFTNLLPKPIDLNKTFGTWQVALLEISWPAKFKNVTHGFIEPHMDKTDSSSDDEEPIEPTSAEELFTDIGRRRRRRPADRKQYHLRKKANLKCKIDTGFYPTIENLMQIFAKSFRTKQENDWPIIWCISSHTQKLKLLSNSGQKDQTSTGNKEGFMTAASSSEDKLTEDETEKRSPTSIKLLSPDLQNILGTHILKIGVNPKYPVDISGGRHTIFVYCDLIQDQILGNKLTSLLRTIALPNNSTQKTQNTITCHQSFSNFQWKNVVKSSFQSINITIRDETGQLMPFLSIGRSWLTLKFQFLPN